MIDMAFKEDWSFLDKITMGAVGTQSVIQQLNASGHQIIELERYCTSNKIWSTKIKRLRIPDLLCLHCGKRIESRAKSKLGIIMSDAENNPNRRWFSGLRENDLVAFIQCHKNELGEWKASNLVNVFSVGDMLSTEPNTKLSAPKSVYEGAERDRTWASYVPSHEFTVAACNHEKDGTRIQIKNITGRNQSKLVSNKDYIYVNVGETYPGEEKIVSGIVPHTHDCGCTDEQYDFLNDLNSNENETQYTAVKALGFLPVSEIAKHELQKISVNVETDSRIRLEAYASLLRLGVDVWDAMYDFAFSQNNKEIKMEYALILGELNSPNVVAKLMRIIENYENDVELRAAALWSLPPDPSALTKVIDQCFSEDNIVMNHAIAKIEKYFSPEMTNPILSSFGSNEHSNAICAHILASSQTVDREEMVKRYISEENPNIQNWILFSIGLAGPQKYEAIVNEIDPNAELTKDKLIMLWNYHPKFLNREQSDGIEFIKKQK
jgi:hypothetical protein